MHALVPKALSHDIFLVNNTYKVVFFNGSLVGLAPTKDFSPKKDLFLCNLLD